MSFDGNTLENTASPVGRARWVRTWDFLAIFLFAPVGEDCQNVLFSIYEQAGLISHGALNNAGRYTADLIETSKGPLHVTGE